MSPQQADLEQASQPRASEQAVLDIPPAKHGGLRTLIISALLFNSLFKLFGLEIAVALTVAMNGVLLATPISLKINTRTRRLSYSYRRPFALLNRETDLSPYTVVYTQADSYASRSLHLSGLRGEHLLLANFNGYPISMIDSGSKCPVLDHLRQC